MFALFMYLMFTWGQDVVYIGSCLQVACLELDRFIVTC